MFKYWGELVEKDWSVLGERLVSVIRPSMFPNWCIENEVRLLPHRDREIGVLLFLMIIFQRGDPQVSEKDIADL